MSGGAADGSGGSYTYLDRLTKQDRGWRIAYRQIIRQDRPLGGRRSD